MYWCKQGSWWVVLLPQGVHLPTSPHLQHSQAQGVACDFKGARCAPPDPSMRGSPGPPLTPTLEPGTGVL